MQLEVDSPLDLCGLRIMDESHIESKTTSGRIKEKYHRHVMSRGKECGHEGEASCLKAPAWHLGRRPVRLASVAFCTWWRATSMKGPAWVPQGHCAQEPQCSC